MVNTKSEANRVPRDDQNAQEEGNSNDPQLARLNERMEQMAKNIEDLATMNAVLQAQVPELHRTVTDPENREARDNHIGERREEERHEGSRVEGFGERNGLEEEIHRNLPPPQTETERTVQGMIARLEQRCNILTAAIQRMTREKLP
jgi:chromosome segregation ATPase